MGAERKSGSKDGQPVSAAPNVRNKLPECPSADSGLIVCQSRGWPNDTEPCGGPNAPEFATGLDGHFPEPEGDWVGTMHDMNKELADYIRENLTIHVGGFTRLLPIRNSRRKH